MNAEFPTTRALRAFCLFAALMMIVQLFFLAEPAFADRAVQLLWDKTVHFLFFGVIAFFLWIATAKRWPLLIWAVVLLIGALDETRQYYIPGRNADVNDWLADGFGAAAALIVAQRLEQKRGQTPFSPKKGSDPVFVSKNGD